MACSEGKRFKNRTSHFNIEAILLDNLEKLLLLIAGLAIGAVAVFVFMKPQPSVATSYVTYSNVEEWEFLKDERGRVTGVRVHRKAEQAN